MEMTLDSVLQTIQKDESMFFDIIKKTVGPSRKHMSYYHSALKIIETKLRVLNEEFSFRNERNPIDTIKSRIKDFESTRKKLQHLGFFPTTDSASIEKIIDENIHDIAGIRVICPFIDDIYMLAECLLKQDDIKLVAKKDYIARPKENGYRSLHLIVKIPLFLLNEKKYVKVEIQLRTIAMDFWANLEHRIRYKKDLSAETAKKISAELSECAETSALLDMQMKNIRDCIDSKSV